MPWQALYDPANDLVDTTLSGHLTPPELVESVIASIELSKAHGTARFLFDVTQLTGGHSVFDLYALAEQLHDLGISRGAREALVVPTLSVTGFDAGFWETLCRNRGLEVCCFIDRPRALAWLNYETQSLTGT